MEPSSQNQPNEAQDMTKKTATKSNIITNESGAKPANFSGTKGLASIWRHASPLAKLTLVISILIILGSVLYVIFTQSSKTASTNSSTKSAATTSAQMTITPEGFSPATISIKAGTHLTWTNTDPNPHQVAADPYPKNNSIPGFDSTQVLQTGDSYIFSFDKAGTYHVHDQLNPLKFTATIVVK
jgi:plastocyanin